MWDRLPPYHWAFFCFENKSVTFFCEQAAEVFLDPLHLTVFDDDHSDDDERWSTLGKLKNNQYIVVIHTFEEHPDQSATVRIISGRKATQREQRQYEEN